MSGREIAWEQMRKQYEAGGWTYQKLAEAHGVGALQLARRAVQEGWNWKALQRRRRQEEGLTTCLGETARLVAGAMQTVAEQLVPEEMRAKDLKELAGVLRLVVQVERELQAQRDGQPAETAEPMEVVMEEDTEAMSR